LTGGTGRNLLIAGPMASTLVGQSDEDILVGGTTGYENNPLALTALMAEWTRPDLPYSARVHDLLYGLGLNGSTRLDQAAFPPNAGGNALTGAAGLDLFYGSLALDKYDWDPTIGEIFIEKGQTHASTQINIGALNNPYLMLDGTSVSASSSQRLTLTPGNHTLAEAGGGSVTFQVAVDGTVSYDSSLQGILSGQGTNLLTVNGVAVTINASALNDPYLALDYYIAEKPDTFQVRLLPGSHLFQTDGGGTGVSFTVDAAGNVSYDPSLQGILSGQGTNLLTVNGVAVTINAQALTSTNVSVDYYASEATATPFILHLLPGQHLLQGPSGSVSFTVNPDGTITFPASEDSLLALQGNASLIVKALS
jgi:hypothetical protein